MTFQSHRSSPSLRRPWLWWARTSVSHAQQLAAAAPQWPSPGRRTMRSWPMQTWRTLHMSVHRMAKWWSTPLSCTSVMSHSDMRAATSVSSPTTSAPRTQTRPGSPWTVGKWQLVLLRQSPSSDTLDGLSVCHWCRRYKLLWCTDWIVLSGLGWVIFKVQLCKVTLRS